MIRRFLKNRDYDLFDQERTGSPLLWWLLAAFGLLAAMGMSGAFFLNSRNVSERAAAEYEFHRRRQISQAKLDERLAERERSQKTSRDLFKLKKSLFPEYSLAIDNGDNLVNSIMSPNCEILSPRSYIGDEAVFVGCGPLPEGELDLRLNGGIRLKTQLAGTQIEIPNAIAWTAIVLGKIVDVDPKSKTITLEMKPENWIWGDTW